MFQMTTYLIFLPETYRCTFRSAQYFNTLSSWVDFIIHNYLKSTNHLHSIKHRADFAWSKHSLLNTKIDRMWLTELQSDWVWCGLWIVSSTEACVTGVWRTSWTGGVLEYPCNSSPHSMELQLTHHQITDHRSPHQQHSYFIHLLTVLCREPLWISHPSFTSRIQSR